MPTIVTGLSPLDSGENNARILQRAVDGGGELLVGEPGIYRLADTILLGDYTHLRFAPAYIGSGVPRLRIRATLLSIAARSPGKPIRIYSSRDCI